MPREDLIRRFKLSPTCLASKLRNMLNTYANKSIDNTIPYTIRFPKWHESTILNFLFSNTENNKIMINWFQMLSDFFPWIFLEYWNTTKIKIKTLREHKDNYLCTISSCWRIYIKYISTGQLNSVNRHGYHNSLWHINMFVYKLLIK